MAEPKFNLTSAGFCVNPACGRQLYLELMVWPDDEACYECNPLLDGVRAPMVVLQGGQSREPFDLHAELSKIGRREGHCTEACCKPFSISFVDSSALQLHREAIADVVACAGCGLTVPRDEAGYTGREYVCLDCLSF
jgi:hypothetical protein